MRIMKVIATLILCLSLVWAAGCTVGPDYFKPETEKELPQQFKQHSDPALIPTEAEIKNWWTVFGDDILSRLIEEASQTNLDLREAVARVDEARARMGVATSAYAPQIGLGIGTVTQGGGGRTASTSFSAGLDASWELDLFGRIRRSVESATAEFEASEEDRVDVMISMYAEVALNYISLRTLQERLEAAIGNINSQQEVLKLTQNRFKNGLASRLDVVQAESVLASSEAAVPPLRIELARAINTLAVLLAKPPGYLDKDLSGSGMIPLPPAEVAVGVPADLLRQRPDIRRAERLLAAQTARIGVAEADLYPTFGLQGSIGFKSPSLGDALSVSSLGFSFGPSFRWNLFDGGRVRSQIKVEDALTTQALIRYESTVLNALNEAENAMVAFLEQRVQYEALTRSLKASNETLRLATGLYKDGLVSFQEVLDAQRSVFGTANQVAQSQGNAAINMVKLYKSLGGGWDPEELDQPRREAKEAEKKAP